MKIVYAPTGDCRGYEKLTTAAAIGFSENKINLPDDVGIGAARAKAVLISVETADIRFTMNGTTPVITATSGGTGHLLASGQSFIVDGYTSVRNFKCINAVADSGAIVRCSFYY